MIKLKPNLKNVVPKKYYDLLNIFSKKNSDIFLPHQKFNYKIILEEEQKHGHSILYKILIEKLDTIKHYLNSHLAKRFM